MALLELILSIWILISAISMGLTIVLGMFNIRRVEECEVAQEPERFWPPLEVLVPIKGIFPNQEAILKSLLTQNYPTYYLSFILENEHDEANEVVGRLCEQYSHARKVVSGPSEFCAQKNHSLVAGVKALRPDTEIVLFCDSTNMADSEWLKRFVRPIVNGSTQVVTTFRAFKPDPETIGGVCQALYAALLRILATMRPTPWGGATALRREVLEKLLVVDLWSRTVVDDLVLGNILEAAGIKVMMDPCNLLTSPLRSQSVSGFLAYLDRQILFPKFTNPGIWLATVAGLLDLALAIFVSMIFGALFVLGMAPAVIGCASYVFLSGLLISAWLLRKTNPSDVSTHNWLMCVIPCILFAAFICLRSITVNHIDWHGRRYWPGKGGVVLRSELLKSDEKRLQNLGSI